jgi:hypothetical protein
MARIYENSGLKLYNVSWAVGDGMPNGPDDVMLVQWMLKRHFMRSNKSAMLGNNIWGINAINGVCSDELIEIIKIYQYDAALTVPGARMTLNGKIYPIQSCKGLNHSPMALLNFSVHTNFKKYYENPQTDPLLTRDIKAMLDRAFGSQLAA